MTDRMGRPRNGPYDYGVPSDYDDESYDGRFDRQHPNVPNGQANGQPNGQNGYGSPNGWGGQVPDGYAAPNGNGYGTPNGNGYGGPGGPGANGSPAGPDYYSDNYDYSEPYDYFGGPQGGAPRGYAAPNGNGNGYGGNGYAPPRGNGFGGPGGNGYAGPNGHGAPARTQPPPVRFPGPDLPLPPPQVSSGETMKISAYSARLLDIPGIETRDERLGIPTGPSGGRAERRRAAKRAKRRRRLSVTKEIPILVGVALFIALVLKTFLVQAFVIPSGSMEQTIKIGDRVLVDKLTPWFGTKPERGDVVVFEDPGGWLPASEKKKTEDPPGVKQGKEFLTFIGLLPSEDEQDLIKRVIAVGGDEVKCCNSQGKVTVNGKAVDEPYINPGNKPSDIKFDVQVPNGRVFVMGDHRANSADSRFHLREKGGTVPEAMVQGRAVVIAWPFDHWSKLEEADTFTAVPDSPGSSASQLTRGPAGGAPELLAQYPIPAELPLVMGVVGLSRLWDRRQWIVRSSDSGGLGGRRTFRFRRERGREPERHAAGEPGEP